MLQKYSCDIMNPMISNKLKVVLGMYFVTLLVMLFVGSVTAGLITLTVAGALAVVAASYIINYIKNFDVPLRSKLLSVLLINTILYSIILIFFGLSRIDLGDMGALLLFIMFVGPIFVIISILNGVSLVVRNKSNTIQGNHNKKLLSVALILLLVLSYLTGFFVIGVAKLAGDPALCSFQVKPRERVNEPKGVNLQGSDYCIFSVAKHTLNVNDCKQMKGFLREDLSVDRQLVGGCVRDVAIGLGDAGICNQDMISSQEIENCVFGVQFTTGTGRFKR